MVHVEQFYNYDEAQVNGLLLLSSTCRETPLSLRLHSLGYA